MAVSLPVLPEVATTREELEKVAILSIVDGAVNESSVMDVVPAVLNIQLAGPITPFNECDFVVPLKSRAEVKEICKMGTFKASTKDGVCSLRLAPWSAELGAEGRASGNGQWLHIWNLPLHGWSWGIISEVLRPTGELVAISQAATSHKRFISVLVRCRASISLPLEFEVSLGMRRYVVVVTSDRCSLPVFNRELGRYVVTEAEAKSDPDGVQRAVHGPSCEDKGKNILSQGGDAAPASVTEMRSGRSQVDRLTAGGPGL